MRGVLHTGMDTFIYINVKFQGKWIYSEMVSAGWGGWGGGGGSNRPGVFLGDFYFIIFLLTQMFVLADQPIIRKLFSRAIQRDPIQPQGMCWWVAATQALDRGNWACIKARADNLQNVAQGRLTHVRSI